jgi:toxin ParE1/3/4
MVSYKLNEVAAEDLERLYENGIATFGLAQADHYYDGLIQRFHELAKTPCLWQAVDHIRVGYRRSVYVSHSIYYRIDSDNVEIMRILGREDIENQF